MSIRRLDQLKPAGIAVAEAFAAALERKRRTLPASVLDPDGVEELAAAGLVVRDPVSGPSPTISVTDAGVLAIKRYWPS